MPVINAFLLSRESQDTETGIRLIFWLHSKLGPLKVIIEQQKNIFFIRQKDKAEVGYALSSIMGIEYKNIALKTFQQDAVTAVYFKRQQSLYLARDILQKKSIACYEADIRPIERYLGERFINSDISVQYTESSRKNQAIYNPHLSPGHYQPGFNILSLDIETDYQTNELFSISFYNQKFAITLMRGDASTTIEQPTIEFFPDTKSLLKKFIQWMQLIDADIIIGWNIVNFDFRFLQQQFDKYKIPFTIGRQNSTTIWRQARTEKEHYFLKIPGRIVLDGIDTLKNASYHFDSFSLDTVAYKLLNRGKLIPANKNTDPLYKAKQIQQLFKYNKSALAAYNIEDCKLVWDIFEQTELISFAIERSRLTGLEMDRVGGSVAAFDNLYLPRLHRKGYVAPNIGDHTGDISAPGGYVMNSKPGLHKSVLVLDYKSLYPSIILSFHIDPYARIAAQQQTQNEVIPGFNGASFSKNEYILPDIIRQLWSARDRAKEEKNQTLSHAIKIIMNSFYGVLGTPGCRIHDSRLTSSITLRGHEIMQTTARLIEEQGYDVIYGDTDSIFVAMNKQIDNTAADKLGEQLTSYINNYWTKSLADNYGIDSYLEMEYETHFQTFFMPTIRGSEKGSKKRYAGLRSENGEKTIVFKGLESVRSDWTQLAREFQQQLYEKIFNNEPYRDYILQTIKSLQQGVYDEKLVYRKRLRQKLTNYKKNIPPHARAALKAEYFFSENKQLSRYQQAGWIEYVMTLHGPETLECQTSRLDYQHYIDKQLSPIADTILSVLDSSMEKICQQQYSLFD